MLLRPKYFKKFDYGDDVRFNWTKINLMMLVGSCSLLFVLEWQCNMDLDLRQFNQLRWRSGNKKKSVSCCG